MTRHLKTLGVLTMAIGLVGGCKKEKAGDAPAETATKATEAEGNSTSAEPASSPPKAVAGVAKTERGFTIHTKASAPAETQEVLDFYQKTFSFVPNLGGVMAESPALLMSYYQLQNNLQAIGSLTPPEDNIVQMSIAMENECQYCVAGHTMAGKVFFKSPDEQLEAIRAKAKLPEAKFNALRDFALQVYESKGRVTDAQLKAFFDAGYTRKQALDVVANVAAKVMSNYTNQLAHTPLDEPLKPLAKGLPFAEDRKVVKAN